ncbi:MAG TPA: GDP-L-fucose synthase [Phenylobacterium sp.]|uniref:GDP-L-fucose synthase n=1 Tax=Phenylobacterium sp. TaxID=1871053 RepID=UPI002D0F8780|nr:GDP-L-fucose synthase [Phenylobacterium sp.]HSV03166.1 GDP-L-fucose synthase [Phenylobacterium sp.]
MPTEVRFPLDGKRVWVAGHRGMVGSAIVRRLQSCDCEVITVDRSDVDLRDQAQTRRWIETARPDAIFLAAAKVGGIYANETWPAEHIYDNLMIEANVIEAAHRFGVRKLLFLGSSCIYPKFAPQPIPEEALLSGPLEPTNEAYAVAKIAGIKLAQAYRREYGCDFISAMPTNLYGPGDNFDLTTGHVLPALIRKAHDAKQAGQAAMQIWGSGQPRREFLHADDCADALVFLMAHYSDMQHVNVGSGEDLTVLDLTRLICDVVGFRGEIACDQSKPDGTPRKLMSVERLRGMGWTPNIPLRAGIERTYRWYLDEIGHRAGESA